MLQLCAQCLQPDAIFIDARVPLSREGWPVGPTDIDLPAAFPEVVRVAQRRAHWLAHLEKCEAHQVDIDTVMIEGARLGSGTRVNPEKLNHSGLHASYAEVCGQTLFIITPNAPDEHTIARALSLTHTSRAVLCDAAAYEGLVCSFARQNGEDFGFGMIQTIDFERLTAQMLCDAVPPAPVRTLRIGSLKIDDSGRELGESRPWQV
jgi:polynucleotide 5'-kinase involved in rRNA processing